VLPRRTGQARAGRGARPDRADVQRAARPAYRGLRPRQVRMIPAAGPVAGGLHAAGADEPRELSRTLPLADRIFHVGARGIGLAVLVIFGSIGVFLGLQSVPTLRRYGWHFFVESQWLPERDVVGISAVVVGTVVVALVALVVAFPLALTTALYISEYAPLV